MLKNTLTLQPYARPATLLALLALLLLSLSLVACGGSDAAGTDAATVVAEPPLAATEPSVAEATAAPTTTPEAPATEPAAEATPAVASDADSAAALPSGNCGNPFLPVVEGRVLTYRSNVSGLGESEFTQTYSDVTGDSFTVTIDLGEGNTIIQTWLCTGEGLLQPEFSQLPAAAEGLAVEFVEAEGVTVPTADQFVEGSRWPTRYVANATIADAGGTAMTMVQTVELSNQVVGVEAVSVPAGDYPAAVRVDTGGIITAVMSSGGVESPVAEIPISFSSWYVEGLGLVRSETSGMFGETGASVTELLSVGP